MFTEFEMKTEVRVIIMKKPKQNIKTQYNDLNPIYVAQRFRETTG